MVSDVADVIEFPEPGRFLSDYNDVYIQAIAFPTLFPHGHGDATCKYRRHAVTLTEANAHLLRYCVMKPSFASNDPIKYKYNDPFPEHTTWQHWAQNTADLHRNTTHKTISL